MISVRELLVGAYVNGSDVLIARRQGREPAMVLDGLKPQQPPVAEGTHWLTPEQVLMIRIPHMEVNGRIVGYQRPFNIQQARAIADAMREGVPMPPVVLALDGHGQLIGTDGQHRLAASVISRIPVWVVTRKMTKDEQSALFTSQQRARRIDRNIMVMTGTSLFDRYVQAAVCESGHAWSELVSANPKSRTRMGPYAMFQLLVRYVGDREGQGAGWRPAMNELWDKGLADELAPLIACFGDKQSNPAAFRASTLQAIGSSAMWVFRRRRPLPDDYPRWVDHMPTFKFEKARFATTQQEMTRLLVEHWNKGLRGPRRVA